jgi:putative colanic acid biosynthesis acetyltransferase WcaF
VAPGLTIGTDAVVTAGSVVVRDLPAGMVCQGNPCVPVRPVGPEQTHSIPS